MSNEKLHRAGIIGTGFIARGLNYAVQKDQGLCVSRILTRRNPQDICDMATENGQITNSVQEIIDNSDIIIECSGDPIHATKVLSKVLDAGIPVVTMDSELQITAGSWLSKKGLITEAEGDQPGSLAALNKDVIAMGFSPVVFGNIKGFLNHNPTEIDMKYWANRSGISVEQVTSFTDGTKIQIEQTLVANGLGADIAQKGLLGISDEDYQNGGRFLAEKADFLGTVISDYVLSPKSPAGVFIVAKHEKEQVAFLKYYKLGDGPYYVLTRPFHICHLEILKTVKQVLRGDGILLNNSDKPRISVATIAKRHLLPGEKIERGIGSFVVRGEAVKITEHPDHLPIGLASNIVVKHDVDEGQMITFGDVEVPESQALTAWQETVNKNESRKNT